jgi:uncharacterized protein (DUF2062 family)
MLRRLVKAMVRPVQPIIDRVTSHPFVLRYLPAVADPDVWHLNRRSAARGVGVGLFCGLIPGPLQIAGSVLGCLAIRGNLPVAAVTTFYTNPFTIVPLYVVAYEYGRLFFPDAAPSVAWSLPQSAGLTEWMPALLHWMAELGKPLAVGLVLLATTLAVVGWVTVHLLWRWYAVRAWRQRARLRASHSHSRA